MVSIAGSKKLKRQMAPTFWGISRKNHRFVVTVRPGPHPKSASIPSAVLLRDTMKLTHTNTHTYTDITHKHTHIYRHHTQTHTHTHTTDNSL